MWEGLAAISFILTSCYFHFQLAKTGSKVSSAQTIALRTPQLLWSFLFLTMAGFFYYPGFPIAALYYAFRFGAAKKTTGIAFVAFTIIAFWVQEVDGKDFAIGNLLAIALVFTVDLLWNYRLKRLDAWER